MKMKSLYKDTLTKNGNEKHNLVSNNSNLAVDYQLTLFPELAYNKRIADREGIKLPNEYKDKELINSYNKDGFNIKIYKPKASRNVRAIKDSQIKHDILNIVKDLTLSKK